MAEPASSGTGPVERETTVNDTRRKCGRAAAPVLSDDLVWEIFYRLPVKEILRCRAACRSWHRLSCDDEFLLAHHQRQPSLQLVSFRSRNKGYTSDASVDAFDLRRTPAVHRPVLRFNDYNNRRNFCIHASCDGLLLLSLGNSRFYICNPATRQWLTLPALTGGNVAALYHHRPSGEYHVLHWKRLNKSTSESAAYSVLTVGSSEGERHIGLPVASPSMKSNKTHWLVRACEQPPALLHDCLHWYVHSKVVVFDTLVESFKLMRSPIVTNSAHLLEMDGTFGLGHTHVDGDTMIAEVWVLQDYKMEIWSSKYKTELPLVLMTDYVQLRNFCGQVVSENGDVLVILRRSILLPYHPGSPLFHFDNKGKLLEGFDRQDDDPMVLGLCFKESLVRHVFFQRKDAVRVRVPRFFGGL